MTSEAKPPSAQALDLVLAIADILGITGDEQGAARLVDAVLQGAVSSQPPRPVVKLETDLTDVRCRACAERAEKAEKQLAKAELASRANFEEAEFARVAREKAERERDEAIAALPSSSGRDENRADRELGEVMRHDLNSLASIGVVDALMAKRALVSAYQEINSLHAKVERRELSLHYIAEAAGVTVDEADSNWASHIRVHIVKVLDRLEARAALTPTDEEGQP